MFRNEPDTHDIRNYIRSRFNMESKEKIRDNYGTFCHYLIYNKGNHLTMGPDLYYKRLRYEIPNNMKE